MPDASLLDYIRQQDAAGASRESTLGELLAVGWTQEAVDAAFAALPLPAAAASQLPAGNFYAPRQHAEAASPEGSQPASERPPQTPSGAVATALPGPFALIGEGFSAYRAGVAAVLMIGSLSVALVLAAQLGFAGLVLAGGLTVLVSGSAAIAAMVALAILALVFLVVWLLSVFQLGIAHALDGPSGSAVANVRSALRAAVPQGLSYVWLSVISMAVYIGYLIALCFAPAAIIFAALAFVVSAGMTAAFVIAGVYAFVMLLWVSVMVWTRYVTALWILVEGEAGGARALMLSALRVKPHLGALAWRLVAVGFLCGLAYVAASLVLLLFTSALLPVALATTVQAVLTYVLNYLFFVPLLLGISLAIHRLVKDSVSAPGFRSTTRERWTTYGAAALGPLIVLAVLILAVVLGLSLPGPQQFGAQGVLGSWTATSTLPALPAAQNAGTMSGY